MANPVTVASDGSISSLQNGIALYGASEAGQPDYHFPWDITNMGRIGAVGAASTGVLLEGGGAVKNQVGGYISGGRQGVSVAQLPGTIFNFGVIGATGTESTGVFIHAGGGVTNLGSISGGKAGLQTGGTAANVANYGTVRGIDTVFAYGVILGASSANLLSNSATGYIGAPEGFGIEGTTAPATIVNSGVIENGFLLLAGGSVTNGHSGSTGGLIAGGRCEIRGAPGTVVNYGSITNGFLLGVSLNDGGSVSNAQPSAQITPSRNAEDGIIIDGGLGTVANLGTVALAGTGGGAAVFLGNGGTVVNGSPSVGTALLKDEFFSKDTGIEVRGGPGTVSNFGTIAAGYGVYLRAGGRVANAGTAAYIGGQYFGVVIGPAAANSGVANLGTIKAVGSNDNPGFGNTGARLRGTGEITNGSSTDTVALIAADTSGITAASVGAISTGVAIDASGTVRNFGTIDGTRTAVLDLGGGRVANGSRTDRVALLSAGYDGILVGTAATVASSVTNFGTIAATGTAGVGVSLDNSMNNTVTNSGTISGAGGTAVVFGTGSDRLVVDAGARFGGIVTGGGGTDEIDFNKTGTVRLDPKYVGFSIIRLGNGAPDRLTLTEANFAGVADRAITVHGGNVGNRVDASGFAATHRLDYFGAAGNDKVTGGAGNDRFTFAASALTAADRIAGNGGSDTVAATTGGIVASTGVTGVETFRLANAAPDRLALTNGNFAGTLNRSISVHGGGAGDTVDASQLSASNRVVLFGGRGTDKFSGGAGNDRFSFTAAALTRADKVTGGLGADELDITAGGVVGASGVSGIETYRLAATGADAIALDNSNFAGITSGAITIIGGNAGNSVIAQTVSARHRAILIGGAGPDLFLGGAGNDTFKFTAAHLSAADTAAGAGGTDRLVLTTGGRVHASGVSGVETYILGNGATDSLTLAGSNFADVTNHAVTVTGGDEGNTVNAAKLARANRVTFVGGAGTDLLTGGAGNDTFESSAANLGGDDRLRGGSGNDRLVLTSSGRIAAAGVFAGIETIILSSAGANALTLADGNFAGVAGRTITVVSGNGGNIVNASALTGANRVVAVGGTGTDRFRGGAGADRFAAIRHATMTGGGGSDVFVIETPGSKASPDANRVTDFSHAQGDELAFSNTGFHLGQAKASATPKPLPADLFSTRANGSFDKPGERFAYNKSTGALFFDADGNGATHQRQLAATFANHATLSAGDLFFVS